MKSTDVEVGAQVVRLISEGDRIVDHLARKTDWEPQTRAFWSHELAALHDPLRYAQPGTWTVLDVGAYSGLYGIAAAMAGLKTVCFEPNPTCWARLVENINLNLALGRMSIEPLPSTYALSDRTGEAVLHGKKGVLTSGASLVASGAAGGASVVARVKTKRLDDLELPSAYGPIGLIKIDAEHHEAAIIRGAQEVLRRDRPTLIVEALTAAALSEIATLLPSRYSNTARLDGRNYVFSAE